MDRLLTVTTPAPSKDLTTLAAVKLELGITNGASDAALKSLITAASRAAANKCNGELIYEAVSEQFRPYPFIDNASLTNAPEFIWLRRLPIVAVAALVEDDVTLIEGTDFEIDHQAGRLIRLYNDMPTRWHFRKLVAQYGGGYIFPGTTVAPATLEADLERAVIEIVKDMWFATGRDPLIKSENIPGVREVQYWVGSVGSDGGWPPRVTDLLGPFQRPLF